MGGACGSCASYVPTKWTPNGLLMDSRPPDELAAALATFAATADPSRAIIGRYSCPHQMGNRL